MKREQLPTDPDERELVLKAYKKRTGKTNVEIAREMGVADSTFSRWMSKNTRQQHSQYNRKWCSENRDKMSRYNKKWKEENKEKVTAYIEKWFIRKEWKKLLNDLREEGEHELADQKLQELQAEGVL